MNRHYHIIFFCCGLLLAGGCKKYLDVKPEGSYTETQIYSNETAIQQAFNGLYVGLADNQLYGANLTITTIEMMAQRFKPIQTTSAQDLSVINDYNYASPVAQSLYDSLWKRAYAEILATNVFLSKIDNSIAGKVLTQAHGNQLKGEAIAIRAMVHFDLLRLFGPVYSTDSTSPAIPYYREADAKLQPILTANQTMQQVMTDFAQALQLLAQDPVITSGVTQTPDFYSGMRNQRLNYYAVKGLMARALLYAGNKTAAHDAALSVLTDGEKWFPWTPHDSATRAVNPDRVFSSEILFAVYNPGLYTNYNTYFSPALFETQLLVPDSSRLKEVFEDYVPDYRYSNSWLIQGKPYRTFFKYADLTVPTISWRFLMPLLRKSELYFALAETDNDPVKGLDYLNRARRSRGLEALDGAADLTAELRKEYQKEFWGEGQLFFYYKRINATGVPSGSYPYPWYTVDPTYQVPLPLSETSTR